MGAIIAENYNITKEKTDFSAARLQNSAYAELNSAFKSDRFGRMILYEKDTISSLQMSYDNTIISTIIAFQSVL